MSFQLARGRLHEFSSRDGKDLEIFIVHHASACYSTPLRLQHSPICVSPSVFHLSASHRQVEADRTSSKGDAHASRATPPGLKKNSLNFQDEKNTLALVGGIKPQKGATVNGKLIY
jgi:hypothetical protein